MTGRNELIMSGDERKRHGAIFSLRHAATGETTALHFVGGRFDCARLCAAAIDDTGEDWRVVAVCTPESVYTDLQGSRNLQRTSGIDPRSGQEMAMRHEFDPIRTERQMFGKINRQDLLPSVSNERWRKHMR